MRVIVTGATGNVGSRLLLALARHERVTHIVGLARRPTAWQPAPHVQVVSADVAEADLSALFDGADAVVHLAWVIQPSHDEAAQRRVNVDGSRRVFEAVGRCGVPVLVHASSIGTYAPGPKLPAVDESWPHTGTSALPYARHKATVEEMLDDIEAAGTPTRIVRFRPTLILTPAAASGIRRVFVGRVDPTRHLPAPMLAKAIGSGPACFQAIEADSVATAIVSALMNPAAAGPYNLAAEAPIGHDRKRVMSALALAGRVLWQSRLLHADARWLDLVRDLPLVSSQRAQRELGWAQPAESRPILDAFIGAWHANAEFPTPPLEATSR